MKFLIRDDDTCGITRPEQIIECYQEIWDHIPVGLAVTPFRVPGDYPAIPEPFRGSTEPVPLDSNPEIVAFLKEARSEGKVDILLHGFHHTRPGGMPEYIGGTDLLDKTRQGKDHLESVLGYPVDTFVPPNNGIGREGIEAISACGLNLVNLPSMLYPSRRRFHPENIPHFLRLQYYRRIKHQKYFHVLKFHDHKEVGYNSVTPSQCLEDLLMHLDQCRAADGVFIAALHYHAFEARLKSGETIRDALNILLEKAHSYPGTEFPTFTKMWQS